MADYDDYTAALSALAIVAEAGGDIHKTTTDERSRHVDRQFQMEEADKERQAGLDLESIRQKNALIALEKEYTYGQNLEKIKTTGDLALQAANVAQTEKIRLQTELSDLGITDMVLKGLSDKDKTRGLSVVTDKLNKNKQLELGDVLAYQTAIESDLDVYRKTIGFYKQGQLMFKGADYDTSGDISPDEFELAFTDYDPNDLISYQTDYDQGVPGPEKMVIEGGQRALDDLFAANKLRLAGFKSEFLDTKDIVAIEGAKKTIALTDKQIQAAAVAIEGSKYEKDAKIADEVQTALAEAASGNLSDMQPLGKQILGKLTFHDRDGNYGSQISMADLAYAQSVYGETSTYATALPDMPWTWDDSFEEFAEGSKADVLEMFRKLSRNTTQDATGAGLPPVTDHYSFVESVIQIHKFAKNATINDKHGAHMSLKAWMRVPGNEDLLYDGKGNTGRMKSATEIKKMLINSGIRNPEQTAADMRRYASWKRRGMFGSAVTRLLDEAIILKTQRNDITDLKTQNLAMQMTWMYKSMPNWRPFLEKSLYPYPVGYNPQLEESLLRITKPE